MRLSFLVAALLASAVLPVLARAEITPADHVPADPGAESRALVQRLVLDRAAAVVAVQRVADEREEKLFAELAAKDRLLRKEQRTRIAAQSELADVTEQRQRLVDELASRDRKFATEIAQYRRQVAAIASSPNLRKRDALKRYAEGDRSGGFDALVAIQKAKPHPTAAGWREIAALARDRMDRGEMGTAQVIPFFEAAQSLDADDVPGWVELHRLYQTAGRLPEARHAAEQALAHAQNDRERSTAETALGDALLESGDLPGARTRFEASLKLDEQLAQENPEDAQAPRDLSVSLDRLGEVLSRWATWRGHGPASKPA